MRLFSYIIRRDYGFAPNPFGRHCTLAACKPVIRKSALIGDWIIGVGSKSTKYESALIFAMKVSNKIQFNEFFQSDIYQYKKPIMNGSLKKMYGDNIYFYDEQQSKWMQLNSHHSHEDGSINDLNLNKDTCSNNVLVSEHFFYFGRNAILIPRIFREPIIKKRQGHKIVETNIGSKFIKWLESNHELGYHGDPILFESFKRYNGK